VPTAPRPFHALVDAACEEALALAGAGKVHLVGHSFGAVLAHRLSLRMPERIAAITLLAPTPDLADVFIRLAAFVAKFIEDPRPLGLAIARMQANRRDFAAAQDVFGLVFAVPAFLNAYWSPWALDRRAWFGALMEREPVFDADAFMAIARDAWPELGPPAASGFDGPVDIVYGNTDVLVDPAASLPLWQRAFANVRSRTVRSGHFIQLECPATGWWRASR
jgi:pimeloyl-ACP methyl ester carboxylesterase